MSTPHLRVSYIIDNAYVLTKPMDNLQKTRVSLDILDSSRMEWTSSHITTPPQDLRTGRHSQRRPSYVARTYCDSRQPSDVVGED